MVAAAEERVFLARHHSFSSPVSTSASCHVNCVRLSKKGRNMIRLGFHFLIFSSRPFQAHIRSDMSLNTVLSPPCPRVYCRCDIFMTSVTVFHQMSLPPSDVAVTILWSLIANPQIPPLNGVHLPRSASLSHPAFLRQNELRF